MSLYVPECMRVGFSPRHKSFSAWVDHAPFGFDLIAELKPSLFVELGSWQGFSFFVFCQSVKAHGLDTICYAVDTWQGDEQSGGLAADILEEVSLHARDNYRGFTYFIQSTFEEAADQFSQDSIELLHIDGLHTYEAVKQDFDTWYPKVAPGGIILFHDIAGRRPGFGAWKFWEELAPQHDSFSFHHGHGLGVLRKAGGQPAADDTLLSLLFNNDPEDHQRLRELYTFAGEYLVAMPQAVKFREIRGRADQNIK